MSDKSYLRGFIDGGLKDAYDTIRPVVTAKDRKLLKPIAAILETDIESYRSGYRVKVNMKRLDKLLPQKKDRDYLRGWFAARGKRYEGDKRVTVSGTNVQEFVELARSLGLEMPKPSQPSIDSDMMRVILTGDRAKKLIEILDKK